MQVTKYKIQYLFTGILGKWAPTPDVSSREKETHLIQEALNLTFKCERLQCRLLPNSCAQRQKSWNPEIYEGCMGCNQGLEMAERIRYKDKDNKAA